ncbi:MAG: type II secretion system F family protein [Parvibaculum sp.]|nr:type II secretion system F family protein [Parvibaculum sp.]
MAIFGIAILSALCIAALGFTFISRETKTSQRMAQMAGPNRAKALRGEGEVDNNEKRRKQVQDTLNSLEEKQNASKKISLRTKLQRAGYETEPKKFHMISAGVGLAVAALIMLLGFAPIIALGAGFAAGFGMPRWILNFLVTRRQKAFLEEFANAIDVIVRGVKSGLPINDCLRIIANEAAEPVRTEFRDLVEGQKIGITLDQGLAKIFERMPLAEVNFFQIVLSIQAKSGGNLAEALTNLSKVLRERKKMRAKIQSVSQEAKSSAAIIGSLPPGVMAVLYLTSPDYLMPLIVTTTGNMIIVGGLMWMLVGVLVMRKMINFNF